MILLTPSQRNELWSWFLPDRPGPLVGLHVLQTGNGAIWADRWPEPTALLSQTTDNYSLLGNPDAFAAEELTLYLKGFLDAPSQFIPALERIFPTMQVWDRVILALDAEPPQQAAPDATVRPLDGDDAYHLWGMSTVSTWVYKTWGGPARLASSGMAWGAFIEDRLASIAATFFVGDRWEDIAVMTESGLQGKGLATACARALIQDIRARGRKPSWTTSTDNIASLRVAKKLGFKIDHPDQLYVIGISLPM